VLLLQSDLRPLQLTLRFSLTGWPPIAMLTGDFDRSLKLCNLETLKPCV
jgi:hypothetical protein